MRQLFAALAALLLLPSCALAQSGTAAIVSTPIVTGNCPSWADTVNLIGDSGLGCSNHQLTVSDGTHGTLILAPTNSVVAAAPAIINNTSAQALEFLRGTASTALDAVDFDFRRTANYSSGGSSGYVNAGVRVYDYVTANRPSYEWGLLSVLDNNQAGTQGNQNVAIYGQAHKRFVGAATWASTFELQDHVANPTVGSVTTEYDLQVKGTDSNQSRVINDLWAKSDDGAAATVSWGLRLNTDAHTTINNGITFNGTYINGINLGVGTFTSAGIIMGDGHPLCFDTACLRKKFFSSGVTYQSTPSGNTYSWSDAGQFTGNTINATNGAYFFGGATSSYPQLLRNGAAVDVKLADNSAYTNLTAKNLVISAAGGSLCLDGVACFNSFSASGSTISTASIFTTSAAVNAGTSLTVPLTSGQKLCMDGVTCSYYFTFVGGRLAYTTPSGTAFTIDNAGNAVATTSFSVGFNPGVSCSGAPSGAFASVGGIVTHC